MEIIFSKMLWYLNFNHMNSLFQKTFSSFKIFYLQKCLTSFEGLKSFG